MSLPEAEGVSAVCAVAVPGLLHAVSNTAAQAADNKVLVMIASLWMRSECFYTTMALQDITISADGSIAYGEIASQGARDKLMP